MTGLPTGNPDGELLPFDTDNDWISYQDSWLMVDAVACTR